MTPRILLTVLLVLGFTAAYAQQPSPKSVQSPKGTYAMNLERGRMLLRQGDFDMAYELLADAAAMEDTAAGGVALRLRDASAEAKSAREHFELGDLEEAEASFRHLVAAWPDLSLTFQEYLTRIAETRKFFKENAVEGKTEYAWANKRLRSLDGTQLHKMTSARVMRLEGNQLRRLPDNFNTLAGLEIVYLQKNQIIDASALQNMPLLQIADVGYNNLDELYGAFRGCKALKVLRANYNRIGSVPKELFELPEIEELHLGNNKITVLTADVAKATHLRLLDLSNNGLQQLPNDITKLKMLEVLNLSGNPISNLPEALVKMPNLRVLDLTGTQMDASEVAELKKQLVGCNVVSR
ncbi:MAG: leucine-rich repeat domain-containing protein [Saprospiraceae bacterium]|nr:leucine-rich repeat domain-containing protein [Saprospiraceae bacterium]